MAAIIYLTPIKKSSFGLALINPSRVIISDAFKTFGHYEEDLIIRINTSLLIIKSSQKIIMQMNTITQPCNPLSMLTSMLGEHSWPPRVALLLRRVYRPLDMPAQTYHP